MSKQVTCLGDVIIRYVESDGVKVHETWEREHDEANISHVYPSTNAG